MKGFISSVSVLAAVAHAGIHFRKCMDPEPVHDFDLERYSGKWYEIYVDSEQKTLETGICQTSIFGPDTMDRPHTIQITNLEYGSTMYPHQWTGLVATGEEAKTNSGRAWYNMWYYEYSVSSDYRVLDTDYDTYSLIYSCQEAPFGLMSIESIWVMSRTHTLSDEVA